MINSAGSMSNSTETSADQDQWFRKYFLIPQTLKASKSKGSYSQEDKSSFVDRNRKILSIAIPIFVVHVI